MIYNDQTSSLEEFLEREISFTVHHFNIQSLATEMFIVSSNIVPNIIGDLLTRSCDSYNFCLKTNFVVPDLRTVHIGQSFIQYYSTLIWDMISDYIKDSETFNIFKNKIGKWKPINCLCHLCKILYQI